MTSRLANRRLFPYTTLFRSREARKAYKGGRSIARPLRLRQTAVCRSRSGRAIDRSEEHTSELQSRVDLVCRLLLEKKKCSAPLAISTFAAGPCPTPRVCVAT